MPADAVTGALPGTSALDAYAAAVGLPASPLATSGEAAASNDAAAPAPPAIAGAVSSVAASTTAASSSPADEAATPVAAAPGPVVGATPVDARQAGAERPFNGSPLHVDPGRREDVASSAGPQAVTGDARSGEQRLLTVLSTLDLSDVPSNPQRLRLLPDDAIARLRRALAGLAHGAAHRTDAFLQDDIERAGAEFGPVYAVFANAGYGASGAVHEMGDEALRRMFEVNFFGSLNVIRPALAQMLARQRAGDGSPRGHVLWCSSCLSNLPTPVFGSASRKTNWSGSHQRAMPWADR
jgi:NAD(P)-dependent dehydrogenase (short-subunit alcohol dehydrogenase family)